MEINLLAERQNFIRYATGTTAFTISLIALAREGDQPLIALAAIYFLVICFTDTLHARITNSTNLAMCLAGTSHQVFANGLSGLSQAGLGLLVGLSLLLIPYLLKGVGGGDVKALAALGALVGPAAIFQIFLYIGLIGGVIAVLYYLFALTPAEFKNRSTGWMAALLALFCAKRPWVFLPAMERGQMRFPYAAAITLGFFAFNRWGGLI